MTDILAIGNPKMEKPVNNIPSDAPSTWHLERNLVIEAAQTIKDQEHLGFDPKDYYDVKALRHNIEEAINDPGFGRYYDSWQKFEKFKAGDPKIIEMDTEFRTANTSEDLTKIVTKYKDQVNYAEYLELSKNVTLASLNLLTKNVSAKILPIAAVYAKLAKIIFD
jgi:hypothetical protein